MVPGRLAGAQTVLGVATPATSYYVVQVPDQVSSIGSYNAEIGDILEYGDTITVIATETVTGPTLTQGFINQPMLMVTPIVSFWNTNVCSATLLRSVSAN